MGQQASKKVFSRRKKKLQEQQQNQSSIPSPAVTSISSNKASMFRYREGRRYHEDESIPYVLPNDDEECDRLHQQHWLFRYLFQSNFEVPLHDQLQKGITVLDVGCGPGTWVFEMAEDYPHTQFHGIDIAPVFPEGIKPPNVTFALGNVAERLPFPDDHFDYIHQRILIFGLTRPQWDLAIQESLRVLKPGGWLEFIEVDQRAQNLGPLLKVITDAMEHMLESRNMVPDISEQLEDYFDKHKLDNIHVTVKDFPMRHSGKLGDLFWDDFQQVSRAVKPIVSQSHPEWVSPERYKDYLDKCADECASYQTTLVARSVWGQKPF
ncbi:S-adenosyl-L-methionine-dependent methyltransferase [Halteromyces radiatus]|uniref:S-adenosyl-L-methionine-dependent methyltransferase n=1 Tax=Halteromyces radiatus TaxID=101107 RepID=UPI002220D119|nr:S-adenosyl-L-methionine-dependent methyltransferase [Halteromyces radiatus]KAI8089394.1 S-adenosyl-L-methionine-dependent methyltransferase [Halteromyces radiatus]